MSEQPTCGTGLAANAALPAKLAELIGSVARVLETHTKALDLEDDLARQEYDAYVELVDQHRGTAAKLEALGEQMASYRDLPMGRHDPAAMTSPEAGDALERLASVEQELSSLLDQRLASRAPRRAAQQLEVVTCCPLSHAADGSGAARARIRESACPA